MLFNSFEFALFLPIVFGVYWCIGSQRVRLQNLFLILASAVFYGWWDWRFLLLLFASTSFDYWVGARLGTIANEAKRKYFFLASIGLNLAVLGFFKYFNFFSENFALLLRGFGFQPDDVTLNILLPIGISFYTFHSMSYVIDVYHRRKEPCNDPVAYFAFISFFPLLVAGPIVRATWFLPQFGKPRAFVSAQARDGLRQMLWGFFKKMVIADGCAHFVSPIFDNYQAQPASMLVAGAVLFAFQIYGDFGGYSDVAIGTARLFGFDLHRNFAYPYFSRDVAEFWRRWHISLTSWFRDYVYFPLGGSRQGLAVAIRNTLIIFLLSGFWHGASWTFIIWGLLHALYFIPLLVFNKNRHHIGDVAPGKWLPSIPDAGKMLTTFILVCFAWIFFRAANVGDAFGYIGRMFTSPWGALNIERRIWVFIATMLAVEWMARGSLHGLQMDRVRSRPMRWAIYTILTIVIFYFGAPPQTFIYFQF